jgi:hypothetical protein
LNSAGVPNANEIIEQSYVVQPTELGLASPQMQLGDTPAETARIWQDLHPLYWLLEAPQIKPAARVLAEHPTRLSSDGRPLPVFVMQYVGAGKVLFHATDDTWMWRYRVGDVFFARYWVQAVRYLSRSAARQDSAVELGRTGASIVAAITARVRFRRRAPAPPTTVARRSYSSREGQQNQRVKLSATPPAAASSREPSATRWTATRLGRDATLEGKVPSADFLVVAPPGELERVEMDAGELKRAAEETRGRYYQLADVGRLLDDLPPGHQVPIETLPPEVLWNRWWLLASFLGLIVSEWILRKRKGML